MSRSFGISPEPRTPLKSLGPRAPAIRQDHARDLWKGAHLSPQGRTTLGNGLAQGLWSADCTAASHSGSENEAPRWLVPCGWLKTPQRPADEADP